jgi:predicted nucleic acid-binding protein
MYTKKLTSALIAVIGNETSKDKIVQITAGYLLYAPVSVHWEIGNAFSAMFKRQKTDIALVKLALKAYQEIPVRFIEVSLEAALKLSYSQKIYAYDAYLIQCAQQTSTPLLTLDKSLKMVAKKIGIHILEVE